MPRVVKKPEQRKQELIDIAIKLFFQRGYEGTSIKDIYSEANGSFGMFYHHFKSKEEIFGAAMDKCVDTFIDKLSEILLNKNMAYTKRYHLALMHWLGFLNNRDMVNDYQYDVAVFRTLAFKMLNGAIEPTRLFLEEGSENGVIKIRDSRQTAIFLLNGLFGLMREERSLLVSNKNAPQVLESMTHLIASLLNAEESVFHFKIVSGEKDNNKNEQHL